MPFAIASVIKAHDTGAVYHVIGTLTITGNYSASGDDVSTTFNNIDIKSTKKPLHLTVEDLNGYVFRYDRANEKIWVYRHDPTGGAAGPLDELAAAGYPATLTTDTVTFQGWFEKV